LYRIILSAAQAGSSADVTDAVKSGIIATDGANFSAGFDRGQAA